MKPFGVAIFGLVFFSVGTLLCVFSLYLGYEQRSDLNAPVIEPRELGSQLTSSPQIFLESESQWTPWLALPRLRFY